MRRLLYVFSALPAFTAACQREFPDSRFEEQGSGPLLIPRAEPFPPSWTNHETILSNSFDSVEIDAWSSYYTHGDHVAGRNKSIAQETARKWILNGVPSSLVEYEVYLNYPVSSSLSLNYANGSKYTAQLFEDALAQDSTTNAANSVPAFHGYSASGNVTAEYIYVGQGHKDDFRRLTQLGIVLEGKIALVKYGGPFRGKKVQNAEANGMAGVIIFSDPGSDGPQAAKGDRVYPDGPARHPSSLQRGSVAYINNYIGDPTTPGYPSKPGAARTSGSEILPKIPSLPISYRDAIPLLAALDGHGATAKSVNRGGWIGGLNVTYSTGPAPGIAISMSNVMKDAITPIWNVIGIINGTQADETIIIGNHRDAWIVGGAADPNSGTAVLIEVTKAFGALTKTGWKPRRNIVIASWDAEEYALVGSTEWVEEYAPWLAGTAISYLNLDIAVSGPLPTADATPELRSIAQEVMKKVIYGTQTLYDTWESLYRFLPEDNGFGNLGSGSDYTPFLQLGIGALHFQMSGGSKDPVYHYHSNYDSYYWMSTFADPGFKIHKAVGQYITLLAYHLADDPLLPFDLDAYGRNLNYWARDVVGMTTGMPNVGQVQQAINLTTLIDAARNFQRVANDFEELTRQPQFLNDATKVALANKKLKDFQRVFVQKSGLPGRSFYKNALYAPNRDDGYAAQTYPAIIEGLQDGNLPLAKEWSLFLARAIDTASDILTFLD
ncbi:N-acetylated-alpha-linked acidic dipeptidase [Patellaria atrata CBS 101060]|uniref:N-acetylated-alpha-linked acidic dipeptidase n=1 Tax=Patellaria atrata CBS 101060 TaxID=1346257 RepID=A0A9P4S5B2_9PEZI|nr:N-acetylated-alpha-linked acidic dipeptidase [Patellaria atrata CBS 101060]